MAEPATKADGVNHPVKWKDEHWSRLVRAAETQSVIEHYTVTPTDLIRQGTMRRVDEILGDTPAPAA